MLHDFLNGQRQIVGQVAPQPVTPVQLGAPPPAVAPVAPAAPAAFTPAQAPAPPQGQVLTPAQIEAQLKAQGGGGGGQGGLIDAIMKMFAGGGGGG